MKRLSFFISSFIIYTLFVLPMSGPVEAQEPLPDLVVQSVVFDPVNRRPTVNVANRGDAAAFPEGETFIRINMSYVDREGAFITNPGDDLARSIDAGGSVFFTALVDPPINATEVTIIADSHPVPLGRVSESNEGNNSWVGPILDQNTNGEDLAEGDEDIAAQEIAEEIVEEDIAEGETERSAEEQQEQVRRRQRALDPQVLPGSPLYFFKNSFRGLRSVLTFDSERKAELKLKFATEKILEINKLVDKGEVKKAAEHLKSYEKDLAGVDKLIKKIAEKKPEVAEKFAAKVFRNEVKQQIIIGKVERKATAEDIKIVKEIREKSLEHIAEAVASINDSKLIVKAVDESLNANGSPFKAFRNLEVLKALEEKVPEKAKGAIEFAQEAYIKRFNGTFEALPEKHRVLFSNYVQNVGGSAETYIDIIEEASGKIVDKKALEQLSAAKEIIESQATQPKGAEVQEKIEEALKEEKKLELIEIDPKLKEDLEKFIAPVKELLQPIPSKEPVKEPEPTPQPVKEPEPKLEPTPLPVEKSEATTTPKIQENATTTEDKPDEGKKPYEGSPPLLY